MAKLIFAINELFLFSQSMNEIYSGDQIKTCLQWTNTCYGYKKTLPIQS